MNLATARTAKQKVWDSWGGIIPAELESVGVEDIFKFHSIQRSYDIAFASTFIRTFRAANAVNCRAGDKFAKTVDAFVTADDKNRDREIHVSPVALDWQPNPTPADPFALLAHEYLHWLSHKNFYPNYYKRGGQCPFRVEGFTEYMMLCCFGGDPVTIAYPAEFAKTDAWLKADAGNLDRMVRFLFLGEETDLSALHP